MPLKRNPSEQPSPRRSSVRGRSIRFEDEVSGQEEDLARDRDVPGAGATRPRSGMARSGAAVINESPIDIANTSTRQHSSSYQETSSGGGGGRVSSRPVGVAASRSGNGRRIILNVTSDAQLPSEYVWSSGHNPTGDVDFEWGAVPQVLRFLPEPDGRTNLINERLKRIEQRLQCQPCFWFWLPQKLGEMTGFSALWRGITGANAGCDCSTEGQVQRKRVWGWKKLLIFALVLLAIAAVLAWLHVSWTLAENPYDEVSYMPSVRPLYTVNPFPAAFRKVMKASRFDSRFKSDARNENEACKSKARAGAEADISWSVHAVQDSLSDKWTKEAEADRMQQAMNSNIFSRLFRRLFHGERADDVLYT